MNCEEFEFSGLDVGGKRLGTDAEQLAAAAEHAANCPRCAALQESWLEARASLRELREATHAAHTPQRVELHLRNEFGARHRAWRTRSTAAFAAWALAAVALVAIGISWHNWRIDRNRPSISSQGQLVSRSPVATQENYPSENSRVAAENDADGFTLFPGTLAQDADDAAIVRVSMQRGALSALGLPVNEERVSDWIQVDLLVGPDGQPKAVRLPESE